MSTTRRITSERSLKYPATIFTTILILVAVLLPGSNLPDVDIVGIDKLAHFTLFTMWSISVRRDAGPAFRWIICLIAGVLFSLFTEVLQILVEGRSFDWYDLIADAAGLLFGLAIGSFILRLIQKIFRA